LKTSNREATVSTGLLWRLSGCLPLRALKVSERRVLLLLGDLLATGVAAGMAIWIWRSRAEAESVPLDFSWQLFWFSALFLSWVFLNANQYDVRGATSLTATMKSLITITLAAAAIYAIVFFLAPRDLLPRLVVVLFLGGAFLFGLLWRFTYAQIFLSPVFQHRILVVGTDSSARVINTVLKDYAPHQYLVVGFIKGSEAQFEATNRGLNVMGGPSDIAAICKQFQISEVVLALSNESRDIAAQIFFDLSACGIPVVAMPTLYGELTGRMPIDHLDAELMAASFLDKTRTTSWFSISKRTMDILVGILGLLVTLGLSVILTPLIWIESQGPILYRQIRIGLRGRAFKILKFRTMIPNAEAPGEAKWATPGDGRITRVGRILRRTRLDEIPQFWNVLKGDMSLVGPRPERPEFADILTQQIPFYRLRSIIKPGLTGWAQVQYGYSRSVADTVAKLEYDLYYIKHQSLWLDLWILLRTAGVVLSFKGH
jgi:exopolysaccharide biosynthesis polyprenyl glycosylphosphotransferase